MTGRRMGRCTGNIPANENRTAEDKSNDQSINDNMGNAQPLGMGMARRRGFGGGGGRVGGGHPRDLGGL